MKKYLMFMLAAAFMVSCSDNNENLPEDDGEDSGKTSVFEEHDGYFIYHGETYKTVKLANGTTWMAEPLRYVPEGFTPSADPTADSHIWYPYELDTENGNTAVALTNKVSIQKYGYLYDMYVALEGKEITEENCSEFEGAQGICPKGWHIPTRMEFFALCGKTNKGPGEDKAPNDKEDALFYEPSYTGGIVKEYNNAGWNYILSGVRMYNATTPRYQSNAITTTNTFEGRPALNYIMSSTYGNTMGNGDIMFFAQMTTFTSTYPEGRVTVGHSYIKSGVQVRCVKDELK